MFLDFMFSYQQCAAQFQARRNVGTLCYDRWRAQDGSRVWGSYHGCNQSNQGQRHHPVRRWLNLSWMMLKYSGFDDRWQVEHLQTVSVDPLSNPLDFSSCCSGKMIYNYFAPRHQVQPWDSDLQWGTLRGKNKIEWYITDINISTMCT